MRFSRIRASSRSPNPKLSTNYGSALMPKDTPHRETAERIATECCLKIRIPPRGALWWEIAERLEPALAAAEAMGMESAASLIERIAIGPAAEAYAAAIRSRKDQQT